MACNYYYKGNFIGDELQLADFLFTKEKFYSEYGDLVFDLTQRATNVLNKLNGEIKIAGEAADRKLRNYVAKHGIEYNEDGRQINLDKPAMGTNKFLAKYKHTEGPDKGRLILPEFREKEYWERKKQDWSRNIFTETDKELITELESPDYDFEAIPTLENMNKWAKAIQKKWTAQGETGSALHAVAELFFNKDGDTGKYNFELLDENPALLKEWYDTRFKEETDRFGKIKFGNYVEEFQFNQMVDMCKNLRSQLLEKYGENCQFFPEFTVSSQVTQEIDGCNEIIGIIDLLVVDSLGRTHIFDFKTSPKPYAKYSTAKERGFTYQLATYDRILQHYGIYTGDGDVNIIPIKLDNFKWNASKNKYTFDSVSYEINAGSGIVDVHKLETKGDDRLQRDLDEFLPSGVKLEIYSENLLEKTSKLMKQLCPTYQQQRNMNDEEIRKMIEDGKGFEPDKNGKLVFKFKHGYGEPIEVDTTEHSNPEAEMFRLVKKEIASWTERKRLMAEAFKDAFNEAVENGTPFEYKNAKIGSGKLNSNYLAEIMKPYCDGSFNLIEDPAALCLGIIYLQNKLNDTITVLKLTGALLDWQHEFIDGHTNMNGAFASDVEENSKSDSLMLKATNANIEALEAMLAMQNSTSSYSYMVNEIKVINPRTLTGQPVSNKELLYTYKNLLSHKNVLEGEPNKYNITKGDGPKIKMMSEAEKLHEEFRALLARENTGSSFDSKIRPELVDILGMDWAATQNKELLYDSLLLLSKKLEAAYPNTLKKVQRNLTDVMRPENRLYTAVMTTMMELKGIDTRQQIKDASNWLENKNIFKYGWEGLQIENAGNFKSPMLNLLTKSVSNVYLKVKDVVNKENVTLRRLVASLKKEKNFGWFKSNISGNQTDLYKNMTYVDGNGDFLFVNPNTLHGAEKAFLEHALEVINKQRHSHEADSTLKQWKENGDERYYRVPLMRASDASKMSTDDMLSTTKDMLKKLSPKEALKEMQEKAAGLFTDEDVYNSDLPEKLYEMRNIFDGGEDAQTREKILLKAGGANAFEHNIETILLAHSYNYELQHLMLQEMPLIKATALALSMQGAGANTETGNFDNLINFIEDYVKGVIKNQSIVNEQLRPAQATLGKARKAASFLALAFSPLLFTYQTVEGIWKACSLIIRKPDGTDAFTAKHMWDAFRSAFTDIAHYSDKPTKCLLLNETYGLNDMDANQFAERISSDHGIWTHFTDFAFRFASRPDFYNRLTIFGAQMRADGTWDAHEVDSNGELIYHFDKDKRYAALKNSPKGSAEYNEAMARYIAALEQFQKEGVQVTDKDTGEKRLIKFGDDFPRAYTNTEALSMKAISDGMYGYYNHENKSMMNSMFLGALATQMKTYWSAKKNQYLAPGGVKLMGKWEDYQEAVTDENGNTVKDANGNPVMEDMYYATDEKGEIDLSKPFVRVGEEGNSGVKVQKWKGQWQEGIVATYYNFIAKWHKDGFKAAWDVTYNNLDANLRTAYRSNLKHLLIDLFFAAVVGNVFAAILDPWEEDKKKEHYRDKSDLGKASEYAAVSLLADTFNHSFMDFNFLDSIFSPTLDWQPFAFSSLQRLAENSAKYAFSDASFASTLANSAAVTRQFKPVIRSIGYNED